MPTPLNHFQKLYQNELAQTKARIPGACCLSTIGEDGYPNARFLALKDITEEGFVITGPAARKAQEIKENSKVSLTFWWQTTEVQVRIQGDAKQIETELAKQYFYKRPRESQLTSLVSKQGQIIDSFDTLYKNLQTITADLEGEDVPCPEGWTGFCIVPIRVEFLEFSNDRLHKRTLYNKTNKGWHKEYLQP
jgi:pyridoxamine 5'-phosphate oxidase